MDVTNLGGLWYTTAVGETFPAIKVDSLFGGIGEAAKKKEGSDGGASPAFSCIAVDDDDVLGVVRKELEHLHAHLEKNVEGGRVMVFPGVVHHLVVELLVIVLAIA